MDQARETADGEMEMEMVGGVAAATGGEVAADTDTATEMGVAGERVTTLERETDMVGAGGVAAVDWLGPR